MLFLGLCWCGMQQLFAQQQTTQIIPAEGVNSISIDGNQLFRIAIMTSKTNNIRVRSKLSGEYREKFQIVLDKRRDQVNLKLHELPFMNLADDKISAHKVISAEVEIIIPEDLNVLVTSDIAQLHMDGLYNKVHIELVYGSCFFSARARHSTINTLDGQISVHTTNTQISARSRYGQVNDFEVKNQRSQMRLTSVHGDITVNLDDSHSP